MILRRPLPPIDEDQQAFARAITRVIRPQTPGARALRLLGHLYWPIMLLILGWVASQILDRREPVAVISADVVNPIAVPGGEIKVLYHVVRSRVCETEVSWAIFDGGAEVRRFGPIHYDAVGGLGPDTYVRPFTLPSSVQPGSGRLRVTLAWQCPGNAYHQLSPVVRVLPDLHFEIDRGH